MSTKTDKCKMALELDIKDITFITWNYFVADLLYCATSMFSKMLINLEDLRLIKQNLYLYISY